VSDRKTTAAPVTKAVPSPEHPLLGTPRRDTIVTLLLAAATAALFVLMANHAGRDAIQRIDDAFARRMVSIRAGWLTSIAKFLNVLGLVYVTLPVRLVVAGYLALGRRWWHFAAFVSAVLLSQALIGSLKNVYDRARPAGSLVHTSGGSFPSGHAVAASVTAVAAVIALFPEGGKRYAWGTAAAAFALVMGLSRAYLLAHWLSDAVAGVLLGTSVALGTALAVHAIRVRRNRGSALVLVVTLLFLSACQSAPPSDVTMPTPPRPAPSAISGVPAVLHFRRAPFHLPSRIQREVGTAAAGSVYLAGGLNEADTSVATIEKVDPGRGLVQVVGQMPHRFHDGAAAWIDNRLFVFGGGTGASSDIVQSFSPSRGQAKIEGVLPLALSDLSTATLDGITYLIGGYDGTAPQRTIYATADGRHFHRAGMLPEGLRYAAVAGVDGTLVIAGGETAHGPSGSILAFDPGAGTVTAEGLLPQPLGHASAFAAGGTVYVVGGVGASGISLRAIVAIDVRSGRVSTVGRLAAPLSDAAVVVLGDRAWVFGGLRGSPVSDVLVASVAGS